MIQPRISIVIPCYNQGPFLAECLESIAAQHLPPAEIIVVDDGSTDPYSVARIDELCLGPRAGSFGAPLRLVRQENRGLSGARNAGVRAATGDWILPLDADDQITPDAITRFSAAITGAPEIDIWYPDVERFGMKTGTHAVPPFNPWLLLQDSSIVCSSAISRRVFESGVWYNERLRAGYEDWEFYIHACCELRFQPRALGAPVFRYRCWGYSMLQASNTRRDQIINQVHQERPLFNDADALAALKRTASPALSLALCSPDPALRQALATQTLQDLHLADTSGQVLRSGDLRLFRGHLGRGLLISLCDTALQHALAADPLLLEKIFRAIEPPGSDLAVLWLALAPPESAYPGSQLSPLPRSEDAPEPSMRCVGVVLPLLNLLQQASLPRSGRGLAADIYQYGLRSARSAALVVGPETLPGSEQALSLPALATVKAVTKRELSAATPTRSESAVRERIALLGEGLSRITRAVIGPQRHDALWSQSRLLHRLQHRLAPHQLQREPEVVPDAPPDDGQDPLLPGGPDRQRFFDEAWRIAQQPLHATSVRAPEGRTLLVAAPWVVHGGADRAVVDLLRWLPHIARDTAVYLVTTRRADLAWADQVVPHVRSVIPLADFTEKPTVEAFADLCERLNPETLFIANSQLAFDALPILREQQMPRRRIIAQLHNFEVLPGKEPGTFERVGYPSYLAQRYNNLIDGYAVISRQLGDEMARDYYVSPSKIHVIYLGVERDRLATARAPRFAGGPDDEVRVLWLGRMAEQKDPLLMLQVAEAARARFPGRKLRFRMVGSGPLFDQVRRERKRRSLTETVELPGAVDDPLPLLRDADCLMMTSRFEGIPVVVYEAMAAGLPVITPVDESATEEVIGPEEAQIIRQRAEPGAYVAALGRYVAEPALAQAHAQRLIARSARFTVERYAREMAELLLPRRS